VSSIHLCIRGRSVYENDNYKETCSLCKDLWNESDDALGFQCKLKGFRGIRCLQIATESRLYGFINFFLNDADAFVLYEPYIRNIANLIALTMESKRQRNLLETLNRQLQEDITEHKRIEEALKKEKEFVENLIQTAQVIVLVLDTKGRIVQFNPYMENISGYHLNEVQGKDWFDTFLLEVDRKRIRELFSKATDDIKTKGNVNPIVTKDGREREIEWFDKTLKDSNGQTIGLLAIGQDITERKQARAEREKLICELQEALKNVKTLSSLLPICMSCKKIRDDKGYWNQIEEYITEHTDTLFSHGVCPDCLKKMYSDFDKEDK